MSNEVKFQQQFSITELLFVSVVNATHEVKRQTSSVNICSSHSVIAAIFCISTFILENKMGHIIVGAGPYPPFIYPCALQSLKVRSQCPYLGLDVEVFLLLMQMTNTTFTIVPTKK